MGKNSHGVWAPANIRGVRTEPWITHSVVRRSREETRLEAESNQLGKVDLKDIEEDQVIKKEAVQVELLKSPQSGKAEGAGEKKGRLRHYGESTTRRHYLLYF